MKYVFIGLVIIFLVLGLYILFKCKKNNNGNDDVETFDNKDNDLEIQVVPKILPVKKLEQLNSNSLVKITNKNIISKIDNIVVETVKTNNSIKNVVNSSKNLYEVILPQGEKLSNVKGSTDKFRGFYRDKKHIKGQAEMIKVDNGSMKLSNTISSTMSVASMVVGQYYMEKIDKELTKISKDVEKISNFQENEYKSKIYALTNQVKKIIQFKSELISDDYIRNQTVLELKNLEHECIELLGQATSSINQILNEDINKFEDYEANLILVHEWYIYQITLFDVLDKIAELSYILNLRKVSREYSLYLINEYLPQIEGTKELLKAWNEKNISKFGIDINNKHRNREKFDKLVHQLPSVFNEKYKYKELSDDTVKMINKQRNDSNKSYKKKKDYLNQDVHIVSKDGEFYYLPNEDE